jgi:small subunit ribosomal protein S16
MVVIRLSRFGAKKRPFYQIVVSDRRIKNRGRCIEKLGYFRPMAASNETILKINFERLDYWLSIGAQPSNRITALVNKQRRELNIQVPLKQTPANNKKVKTTAKPATAAKKPAAKPAAAKTTAKPATAAKKPAAKPAAAKSTAKPATAAKKPAAKPAAAKSTAKPATAAKKPAAKAKKDSND